DVQFRRRKCLPRDVGLQLRKHEAVNRDIDGNLVRFAVEFAVRNNEFNYILASYVWHETRCAGMSVDDFCRATRRLRDEVPIPAKNRVAIGVIRPRAVKIDRLVDPRLLVWTGVRHRRLICLQRYPYERPHAIRFKLHTTPRLPTILATVVSTVRACPCKDNSAA